VVGGVIPSRDIAELNKMGIQGVYPGGTPFEEIAESIKSLMT
jgi:methylmalonyl-CoA mutase cobalamin-binding domain/chain